nr:winged helix-turn-helix domain-containing protein [Nonomuraea harbinensis]
MVDVPDWTFLTNHAHVLLCIARDPGVRIRDVAARVQITERAAQRILADLTAAGYLTASREGRRNRYRLNPTLPLRHPLEQDHQIGEILAVFQPALTYTAPSRSEAPSAGAGREGVTAAVPEELARGG